MSDARLSLKMARQKLSARICQEFRHNSGNFRQCRRRRQSRNRSEGAGFQAGIPRIPAPAGIAILATCIPAFWHSGILCHHPIDLLVQPLNAQNSQLSSELYSLSDNQIIGVHRRQTSVKYIQGFIHPLLPIRTCAYIDNIYTIRCVRARGVECAYLRVCSFTPHGAISRIGVSNP
jgi:hypothetical protein